MRKLFISFSPILIAILFISMVNINGCSSNRQVNKSTQKYEEVAVDSTEAVSSKQYVEPEEVIKSEPVATSAKPKSFSPKPKAIDDDEIVFKEEPVQENRVSVKPKGRVNKLAASDEPGMIVYKVPDTMTVFQEYTALVRISRGKVETKLISNGLVKPTTGELRTSDKMTVTLIDASDTSLKMFEIKPVTSELQVVEKGNTYTEWQFSVIPKRSGDGVLRLVVSIPVNGLVKQTVYTDSIKVKADADVQILTFIQLNWKWIVSICLMPIITLIVKAIIDAIRKKKED